MLEGYIELFELCIAMVTALLGLAYPLFINKINIKHVEFLKNLKMKLHIVVSTF